MLIEECVFIEDQQCVFKYQLIVYLLPCVCLWLCLWVQSDNRIGVDGMRELAPALCQLTLLEELYLVRLSL